MDALYAGDRTPFPSRPAAIAANADILPDDNHAILMPEIDPDQIRPLGQILLEDQAISHGRLLKAIVMSRRQNTRLGDILLAQGWVSEDALSQALSRQWRTSVIDPVSLPPDPRLIDRLGPAFCLRNAVLPWRRIGGVTFLALARPDEITDLRQKLPADFGPVRMVLARKTRIHEAIMTLRSTALLRMAECSVPASESCRTRNRMRVAQLTILLLAILLAGALFAPVVLLGILTLWATLTLFAGTVLKLAAFRAVLRQKAEEKAETRLIPAGLQTPQEMTGRLPIISVMVPLFHESDVADQLIGRLARLKYPRELTDILLVTEASDQVTCRVLEKTHLPHWIRVVTVPPGSLQTKPRALNYALNFCRGEIIGIWDAEDRPDPDQLHKVVRGFAFAAPDVACLQGQLDYFNPRTNLLARCFTIEYASWFRANLPGIARLGLVVPLGGTTLFFRRDMLEKTGGWDAWNVTEDADLGVRLARRGWRTELIDTTTDEEANCRLMPWVKQRSRWLKGYAMTWAVHMRQPALLWQELGPKRFIAFQIQFFGTMSQYLLAPILWSFWLLAFGLPHTLREPLAQGLNGNAVPLLFTLFVTSELISMVISLWALRAPKHRHLRIWVPLMHLYFPLGCLAGWKAIYEVVVNPFYWHKTAHGLFGEHEDICKDNLADKAGTSPPGIAHVPVLGQIESGPVSARKPALALLRISSDDTPVKRSVG
ncbi:MAG: glycosyltransferase [Paracoccus sp. (in: a-proteobacteria)]